MLESRVVAHRRDQEAAIESLESEVKTCWRGHFVLESSPAAEAQSNGCGERAAKDAHCFAYSQGKS